MLPEGLYEQVISKALDKKLSEDSGIKYDVEQIDNAEAPSILSKYIAEIAEKGLMQVQGDDISGQISLANKIISVITEATGDDEFDGTSVEEKAQQLLAVVKKKNNIAAVTDKIDIHRPETSLSASSLFTGSLNEPSMMTELKKEICSADRVDMLVSFIKWSGLRLIINELNDFTMRGGKLRIITTSYMGATESGKGNIIYNFHIYFDDNIGTKRNVTWTPWNPNHYINKYIESGDYFGEYKIGLKNWYTSRYTDMATDFDYEVKSISDLASGKLD